MKTQSRTGKAVPLRHIPRTYAALMAMHPLRPIHDGVDLENATGVIDAIAGHALNADQEDYLDALSTLVEAYENEHHPVDGPDVRGLDALRALLEMHGMNASDLARLLGVHRSMGSKLLTGERDLTASHIKTLSEHFKVSGDLFLK